jgi:branched-chain amino acid transport system ATP-binding protein
MSEFGSPGLSLAATGVSVRVGGVQILEDVDIDVPFGSITGLIGPNGAGKTTLINVLSGFQSKSAGAIAVDNHDVTTLKPEELAWRGISRTFQGGRLFGKMTVFENVLAAALHAPASRKQSCDTAWQLLSDFGLTHRSDQYADEIPYGQERLLAIARCLARRPRYLLLDEPAAGLNEAETENLIHVLADLPRIFGCGLLVIEHNMDLIMRISNEVQVLARGKTLVRGKTDAVRRDERVIAEYLGWTYGSSRGS